MTEDKTSTTHPLLDFLSKLSNYLIGITILCYGAGFVITNLYLGSMGIVTFDILRSRYIVAGLVFLFFLSTIGYLIFGLLQTLRKYHQQSRISIIGKVLWFSCFNLGALYLIIPVIGVLAGSPSNNIPQSSPPDIPWSDWLSHAPVSALRSIGAIFLIIFLTFFILIAALIIINPKDKDGKRRTRRQILKEGFQQIKESKGKGFLPFLGIFAFIYIFLLLSSLASFFLAGKVSTTVKLTSALTGSGGAVLLFNSVAIVYALIAVYLTFIFLYPPSSIFSEDDTALANTSSLIYLAAVCVILIVPLYAIRVYPALPQQIGGGQLLRVQVVIADKTIEPQFEDSSIETYLVDRTSNTSFFVLYNTSKSEYKIIEIQNGLIQSMTYTHSP